ncbi:MAG: NAD(P)H-dependent oxidoreductase subunit E [Verrucomicrobia bacterium]|nr:NAD(P)H-dependent oxidoreductase subunit E [Verrucomicrobiota bacterium]
MIDAADAAFIDALLERTGTGPESAIPILLGVQEHFRHLPVHILTHVSRVTGISPAQIEGVASFYHQFRRRPMGRHSVRVCHGTACHMAGAPRVTEALRRHLRIPDDNDTDPQGEHTVEDVFCVGCCSLAPVVQVDDITYGHQSYQTAPAVLADFRRLQTARSAAPGRNGNSKDRDRAAAGRITVCLDSCCVARGTQEVRREIERIVNDDGLPVEIERVSCPLMCEQMPLVELHLPGSPPIQYARVRPRDVPGIMRRHFRPPRTPGRLRAVLTSALDRLADGDVWEPMAHYPVDARDPDVAAFYGPQLHVATEHYGRSDPLDLDAYRTQNGWGGLQLCLESMTPMDVVEAVCRSGLRGRGGGGFPTGRKWQVVSAAEGDGKVVICNGDEGDPGAFMDRMLMESFPFRVLEGMAIAAYAVGASKGIIYVRAEYPYAVQRLREAIALCRADGLLGRGIMRSGLAFDVEVFQGAGAFVCGEETALMESIEGRRGIPPRLKPPYPAQQGLHGQPTLINNVETFCVLPWIMRNGADRFAAIGTESSKGTKVFALAGKVRRPGLIEVPMGTSIHQIVNDIGGAVPGGKAFKAVQIGGPSGGCVPAALAHTPVDYDALREVGAIMGSGGLVVLDEDDCMVDVARYFMRFLMNESCGKCTFCRIGTVRMAEILNRICEGTGKSSDLDQLAQLSEMTAAGSLCGLGRTAANPVNTTLRYFRDEYEAHLEGRCPAGSCTSLVRYVVQENCTGCTICAQRCPVAAIPPDPYRRHVIDDELCTRCDACRVGCPEKAIVVESGNQVVVGETIHMDARGETVGAKAQDE